MGIAFQQYMTLKAWNMRLFFWLGVLRNMFRLIVLWVLDLTLAHLKRSKARSTKIEELDLAVLGTQKASILTRSTASNAGSNGHKWIRSETQMPVSGLETERYFEKRDSREENLLSHWKSMEFDLDIEAERRLMYVAIIRTERYLYISFSKLRKGEFNQKSRLLYEIGQHI